MSVYESIRNILLNDPAVKALVADRIYLMNLPAKCTLPAIMFEQISGRRGRVLSGQYSGLTRGRFQFNCWGLNGTNAVNTRKALDKAFDGASTSKLAFTHDNLDDWFDEEAKEYRASCDYMVLYQEAIA